MQKEKGATEDELVGWQHQFNEHEFEQTPRDSEGQGSLACCSPWGCKRSYNVKLNNNTILVSVITFSGKERVVLKNKYSLIYSYKNY